ncbi:MAG: serine--tRNA ligase [Candidatus Asgardarchaeum californiense]|nr:MAG: serine--tRNA ligase [Candidatus Asgardarchaeum californiense]
MWSILYLLRNNPDKLKKSMIHRGLETTVIDKAVDLDLNWRRKQREIDMKKAERNKLTKGLAKLSPEEKQRRIEQAKKLSKEIDLLEEEVRRLKTERDELLLSIPNVVHETVPEGKDENDNIPIRFYGVPKVYKEDVEKFKLQNKGIETEFEIIDWKPKSHIEALKEGVFVDTERAAKVAGARFYYLLRDIVWLDFALMLYAMDVLTKKGFILLEPPFMLNKKAYSGVTSLEDFEDALYKIESKDLYLISTSEHPMAAMFMNEVMEKDKLPLKYLGVSPCFRKEAGAHGKDTKGIFRVHQFNKVEQFVFTLPEDSWEWHEKLIRNAEELWQGLEIPYRVVNICTGDLGVVAAKKYDIEVWMPGQGRYREVVSCSNCTDYQSYRLNIRYAKMKGYPSEGFVHTLNSTAIATSRAIIAIFENYQQPDGSVVVPKVLRKYLEPFEMAPKDVIVPTEST